jgi:pyridoxal biosynthesis lyase PdxS
MIVQIYEVTTPAEARALGAIGVDHIGVLVGDGSFPREQTIEKVREIFAAIAHNTREILLTPDSPLLRQGERGFNFRTVRRSLARDWSRLSKHTGTRAADTGTNHIW